MLTNFYENLSSSEIKRINKKTATHFKTVYNKFDPKKRSAADDKADELLLELISELKVRVPRK